MPNIGLYDLHKINNKEVNMENNFTEQLKALKKKIKYSLLTDCLDVLEKDKTRPEGFFWEDNVWEDNKFLGIAGLFELQGQENQKLADYVKSKADFFARGLVGKYLEDQDLQDEDQDKFVILYGDEENEFSSTEESPSFKAEVKELIRKNHYPKEVLEKALELALKNVQVVDLNWADCTDRIFYDKSMEYKTSVVREFKKEAEKGLKEHIKQKVEALNFFTDMEKTVLRQIEKKPEVYLEKGGELNLGKILKITTEGDGLTLRQKIDTLIGVPFTLADFPQKEEFYQKILVSADVGAMKNVLLDEIRKDKSILKKKIQEICTGLPEGVAEEVAKELLEGVESQVAKKGQDENKQKEAGFESLSKSLDGKLLKKRAMYKYIENHENLKVDKHLWPILKGEQVLTWGDTSVASDKAIVKVLAEKINKVKAAIDDEAAKVFDDILKEKFKIYSKFAPAEGDNIATIVKKDYLDARFFDEAGLLKANAIKEEFVKKAKEFLKKELLEGKEFEDVARDIAMDKEELKKTIKEGVDKFDFIANLEGNGQEGSQGLSKEDLLKKFTLKFTLFVVLQDVGKKEEEIISALGEVNKILPGSNPIKSTELGTLKHKKNTVLYAMLQKELKIKVGKKDADPKQALLDLFNEERSKTKEILEKYITNVDSTELNKCLANAINIQREDRKITLENVLGGKDAANTASLKYWKDEALKLVETGNTYRLKGPKAGFLEKDFKEMFLGKDTKLSFSGSGKMPSDEQQIDMLMQFCHALEVSSSEGSKLEEDKKTFGAILKAVNKAPSGKVTLTLNIAGKDREVEFGKRGNQQEFSVKVKDGVFSESYAKLESGKINNGKHVGGLTLADLENAKLSNVLLEHVVDDSFKKPFKFVDDSFKKPFKYRWVAINGSLASPNTTRTVKIEGKKFTFKKEGDGFNVVFDDPSSSNTNIQQKTLQFPTAGSVDDCDYDYFFRYINRENILELAKQKEAQEFFAQKVMEKAKGLNGGLSTDISFVIDGKEQKLKLEVKKEPPSALGQLFGIGESVEFLYLDDKKLGLRGSLDKDEGALQTALSSQLGLSKKTLQLSDNFGKSEFIAKQSEAENGEEVKKVSGDKSGQPKSKPNPTQNLGGGANIPRPKKPGINYEKAFWNIAAFAMFVAAIALAATGVGVTVVPILLLGALCAFTKALLADGEKMEEPRMETKLARDQHKPAKQREQQQQNQKQYSADSIGLGKVASKLQDHMANPLMPKPSVINQASPPNKVVKKEKCSSVKARPSDPLIKR